MFSSPKEYKPILIPIIGLVLASFFFLSEIYRTGGRVGVPLDDAFIHFRFAQNLGNGQGFSFNPGEPTPGDTSPLWVILITVSSLITGEFIFTSKALSLLFYLISGYIVYLLCLILTRKNSFSVLCACLALYAGRFAWSALSGMEISLFASLSLWAIYFHIQDKRNGKLRLTTGSLFALATLARPEGYLLSFLALIDQIVKISDHEENIVSFHLQTVSWKPVLLYLVLVLPYPVFSWITAGHFFPNSFYARIQGAMHPTKTEYLFSYIFSLFRENPFIFFLLPVGFSVLIIDILRPGSPITGHSQLLVHWLLFYPLVNAITSPTDYSYMRLMIPLIPGYILIGMLGLHWSAGRITEVFQGAVIKIKRTTIKFNRVAGIMIGLALIAGAPSFFYRVYLFGWNVDNISQMQVKAAQWLQQNIPPQAVIATPDIGAIGTIAQNRIIDLNGIVTPEIIGLLKSRIHQGMIDYLHQDKLLFDYLAKEKPDYLVLFPNLYPALVLNKNVIKEVFRVSISKNTVCNGTLMVIYKADWTKLNTSLL